MGEDTNRIRQQLDETRAQLGDDRPADGIRTDIDHTRSQIGVTMGALGHKADVKGRMSESVSRKKNAIFGAVGSGKDAIVGGADRVVSTITGAVPNAEQVADGARKVGVSKQSPVGLVVAGRRCRPARRAARPLHADGGRAHRRDGRADQGRGSRRPGARHSSAASRSLRMPRAQRPTRRASRARN